MYWRETVMGGYGSYSPFFWSGVGFFALWDLAWKGIALWRAARRKEQWWFIALLVLNTVGILPIAYLLVWGKEDPDTRTVTTRVVKVVKKKKRS